MEHWECIARLHLHGRLLAACKNRCGYAIWPALVPYLAAPQREELLVIKEPGPTNPLMVTCSLEAAPPNGIHATFQLLSGNSFAAYTSAIAPYFPLLLKDLREDAEYQAAGLRLPETDKRSVQILMPGFHTLLPECLPIWQEATITEAELQTHLSHLQSLSLAELRALAANFED